MDHQEEPKQREKHSPFSLREDQPAKEKPLPQHDPNQKG